MQGDVVSTVDAERRRNAKGAGIHWQRIDHGNGFVHDVDPVITMKILLSSCFDSAARSWQISDDFFDGRDVVLAHSALDPPAKQTCGKVEHRR